jgi:hypothetical protein
MLIKSYVFLRSVLLTGLSWLGTGHYLWKWGREKIRGAIKFFKENEGGCN